MLCNQNTCRRLITLLLSAPLVCVASKAITGQVSLPTSTPRTQSWTIPEPLRINELPFNQQQRLGPNIIVATQQSAHELNDWAQGRTSTFLPPSITQHIATIRRAAEQGNSKAQSILGDWYFDGRFVQQDMTVSIKWYKLAAQHGFGYAQFMLAELYQAGHNVKQDVQQAGAYMRQALANKNKVMAQRLLADRYSDPLSRLYRPNKAIYWYTQAATSGDWQSQLKLATLYSESTDREAQLTALKWFSKAANTHHDPRAEYQLGLIFTYGKGVKADPALGFTWFQRAARQRFSPAQYHLAQLYANGLGTKRDTVVAYAWYHTVTQALKQAEPLNQASRQMMQQLASTLSPDALARATKLAWQYQAQFAAKPIAIDKTTIALNQ